MAGPWFTIQDRHDDWQDLGAVWISNGEEDCRGRIQIHVTWDDPRATSTAVATGKAAEQFIE